MFIPRLYVYSNGTVQYTVHQIVHTPCELDLLYFPFDHNHCHIAMGSWSAANDVVRKSSAILCYVYEACLSTWLWPCVIADVSHCISLQWEGRS